MKAAIMRVGEINLSFIILFPGRKKFYLGFTPDIIPTKTFNGIMDSFLRILKWKITSFVNSEGPKDQSNKTAINFMI